MKATDTWRVHGAVTVLAGLVMLIVLPWHGVGFALGTVLAALYFGLVREPMDKLKHVTVGDYDTPQGEQAVTARVDKEGDIGFPVSVAVGAVIQFVVSVTVGAL